MYIHNVNTLQIQSILPVITSKYEWEKTSKLNLRIYSYNLKSKQYLRLAVGLMKVYKTMYVFGI